MMMPPDVKKVRELMCKLPVQDRLAMLLLAILDADTDALNASLRLTYCIRRISAQQSPQNRFAISEALRDLADRLERPLVLHVGN